MCAFNLLSKLGKKKYIVMVCIPCIVIPFALWLFHKYIQPFILKFWNPWEKKPIEEKSVKSSSGDGHGDSVSNL